MKAGILLKRWRGTRCRKPGEVWSQRTLAAELGVTQATISLLERGELMPGLVLSVKIEKLTGIAPKEWYTC
jgi:DNA-binding XRE family transcriptional regulator